MSIWTILFVVLLIAWLGGFTGISRCRWNDPPLAGVRGNFLDSAFCDGKPHRLSRHCGAG